MLSGNIIQQAHYTQSITQPSCILKHSYHENETRSHKISKVFKFHPGTLSPSSLYPFLSSQQCFHPLFSFISTLCFRYTHVFLDTYFSFSFLGALLLLFPSSTPSTPPLSALFTLYLAFFTLLLPYFPVKWVNKRGVRKKEPTLDHGSWFLAGPCSCSLIVYLSKLAISLSKLVKTSDYLIINWSKLVNNWSKLVVIS